MCSLARINHGFSEREDIESRAKVLLSKFIKSRGTAGVEPKCEDLFFTSVFALMAELEANLSQVQE